MIPATQEDDPLQQMLTSILGSRGRRASLLRDGTQTEISGIDGVGGPIDVERDRGKLGLARVSVKAVSDSGASRFGTGNLWKWMSPRSKGVKADGAHLRIKRLGGSSGDVDLASGVSVIVQERPIGSLTRVVPESMTALKAPEGEPPL